MAQYRLHEESRHQQLPALDMISSDLAENVGDAPKPFSVVLNALLLEISWLDDKSPMH